MIGAAAEAEVCAPIEVPSDGTLATIDDAAPASPFGALGALDGNLMSRFEALSRAFKSEVEGLVDKEHMTSRETVEQLQATIDGLQKQRAAELKEAQAMATRLRDFVGRRQRPCLEHIFGPPELGALEPPIEPHISSAADVRDMLDAFVEVNDKQRSPELQEALEEVSTLRSCLDERENELQMLRADLKEALVLKTQEERDLVEFASLRAKDSELHEVNLQLSQARAQLQELQSTQAIVSARAAQSEAALSEKSRRIVETVKKLEEQSEQCRLLSNENNTLRLQLGKDSEYVKVLESPADPLSYRSAVGKLTEPLQQESQRFQDELTALQCKFPFLAGAVNSRDWCAVYLSRQCAVYTSFLHLFQDSSEDGPDSMELQFVSKMKEVDVAWSKREDEMRDADALFQETEKTFTAAWEEKRLALVAERDTKIKQLLEQTERTSNKTEKQLLMQQAKLYGQRMDAQIDRAWTEQKMERDERWAKQSEAKQESRQRFKDESLSVQREADGAANASTRFKDMAQARLASVEDAWLRNIEKETSLGATAMKSGDLVECLRAAGLETGFRLPSEGIKYSGIAALAESCEEILTGRIRARQGSLKELQEQTMQQLRVCVERFVLREGAAQQPSGVAAPPDLDAAGEAESVPGAIHASAIRCTLRARQHRVVADTARRQFEDYLLILRVATLGAARLLPTHRGQAVGGSALKVRGALLDCPPLPAELQDVAMTVESNVLAALETSDTNCGYADDGEAAEEQFLYDSILRRLLDQVLTSLHAMHREELLALKRANARETRMALQSFCQLEASAVDDAIEFDMVEYRTQVKAKLLSDCESQLCDERRQLTDDIGSELEAKAGAYRRAAEAEERAALRERRKWLCERLVLIQSQGAISASDRAVTQRLRAELRVCELRFEKLEREQLAESSDQDAVCTMIAASVDCGNAAKSSHSCTTAAVMQTTPQSPQEPPSCVKAVVETPQRPIVPPPQSRRPSPLSGASRTPSPSSARGAHGTAFPIGRMSGQPREAASLQFPATPVSLAQESAQPSRVDYLRGDEANVHDHDRGSPVPCFGSSDLRPPSYERATSSRAPLSQLPKPQQARTCESSGPDGAAGFGWQDLMSDSAIELPVEATKAFQISPMSLQSSKRQENPPPLYDWPFESMLATPPSEPPLSGPPPLIPRACGTPKDLPEVRRSPRHAGQGCVTSTEKCGYDPLGSDPLAGAGAYSSGVTLGMPSGHSGFGASAKGRHGKPMLPPVASTPRNRAG
jgi:hypothetical protein